MKNKIIRDSLILSILFVLLAIVVFDEISLWFLGMAIVFIGIILLNVINR